MLQHTALKWKSHLGFTLYLTARLFFRGYATVLYFIIVGYTHFPKSPSSVVDFPHFPECLLTRLRDVCFLCWRDCVFFQSKKVRVRREQCHRAVAVAPQSNYLKLPVNRVIFQMLLATVPQRCKLWLHWISTGATIGREVSLTARWWIALWMIVECQDVKLVNLRSNPLSPEV